MLRFNACPMRNHKDVAVFWKDLRVKSAHAVDTERRAHGATSTGIDWTKPCYCRTDLWLGRLALTLCRKHTPLVY
jgi:hypothetical protein